MNNYKVIKEKLNKQNLFFTIAIPHYRYREHLQVAITSIVRQTYLNFEILISDDSSPCDAHEIVPQQLDNLNIDFQYIRHDKNQGYDRNVRFCIKKARGKYIFLLGNDDDLTDEKVLEFLYQKLHCNNSPKVAFTSYSDFLTGEIIKRAQNTKVFDGNINTAVKLFRAFSFVSGLIFDREESLKYDTDIWDHSVYYQFYLACKLMCEGNNVCSIAINAVRINTAIDGKKVPTAAVRPQTEWSFAPRYNGMDSVIRVVINTIIPYVRYNDKSKIIKKVIKQIYTISYPHALMHYRTHRNWSYSVGVARRMRPDIIFAEYMYPIKDAPVSLFDFKFKDRFELRIIYTIFTVLGLLFPIFLYDKVKTIIGNIIRKSQQK